MVVVVIIGILSTGGIFLYVKVKKNAAKEAAEAAAQAAKEARRLAIEEKEFISLANKELPVTSLYPLNYFSPSSVFHQCQKSLHNHLDLHLAILR